MNGHDPWRGGCFAGVLSQKYITLSFDQMVEPEGRVDVGRSQRRQAGQMPLGICPARRHRDHPHLDPSQGDVFLGRDTRIAGLGKSTNS